MIEIELQKQVDFKMLQLFGEECKLVERLRFAEEEGLIRNRNLQEDLNLKRKQM